MPRKGKGKLPQEQRRKKGRGGRRITQIIRQKFLKKEKNTKKI